GHPQVLEVQLARIEGVDLVRSVPVLLCVRHLRAHGLEPQVVLLLRVGSLLVLLRLFAPGHLHEERVPAAHWAGRRLAGDVRVDRARRVERIDPAHRVLPVTRRTCASWPATARTRGPAPTLPGSAPPARSGGPGAAGRAGAGPECSPR